MLLEAAHLAYIAPGSGAGAGQPLQLDDPDASTRAGVADQLAALAQKRGRDPDGARRLAGDRIGASDAFALGATNGVRPTIGELIVRLDGKSVTTAAGEVTLVDGQGRSAPGVTVGASRTRRCASAASGSTARSCTG